LEEIAHGFDVPTELVRWVYELEGIVRSEKRDPCYGAPYTRLGRSRSARVMPFPFRSLASPPLAGPEWERPAMAAGALPPHPQDFRSRRDSVSGRPNR